MLDAEDSLALCLARAGERQSFSVLETPGSFGIDGKAHYRIEGDSFIVMQRDGQVRTILGYPAREILHAMRRIG